MPAAAAIVLTNDDLSTASHTPVSVSPEYSIFENRDNATSAGYHSIGLGFSRATPQRKTTRVRVRYAMPIEQTVDGIVRVSHTPRFNGEFILPEEMTATEKLDLQKRIETLISNAFVQSMVEDNEPVY